MFDRQVLPPCRQLFSEQFGIGKDRLATAVETRSPRVVIGLYEHKLLLARVDRSPICLRREQNTCHRYLSGRAACTVSAHGSARASVNVFAASVCIENETSSWIFFPRMQISAYPKFPGPCVR